MDEYSMERRRLLAAASGYSTGVDAAMVAAHAAQLRAAYPELSRPSTGSSPGQGAPNGGNNNSVVPSTSSPADVNYHQRYLPGALSIGTGSSLGLPFLGGMFAVPPTSPYRNSPGGLVNMRPFWPPTPPPDAYSRCGITSSFYPMFSSLPSTDSSHFSSQVPRLAPSTPNPFSHMFDKDVPFLSPTMRLGGSPLPHSMPHHPGMAPNYLQFPGLLDRHPSLSPYGHMKGYEPPPQAPLQLQSELEPPRPLSSPIDLQYPKRDAVVNNPRSTPDTVKKAKTHKEGPKIATVKVYKHRSSEDQKPKFECASPVKDSNFAPSPTSLGSSIKKSQTPEPVINDPDEPAKCSNCSGSVDQEVKVDEPTVTTIVSTATTKTTYSSSEPKVTSCPVKSSTSSTTTSSYSSPVCTYKSWVHHEMSVTSVTKMAERTTSMIEEHVTVETEAVNLTVDRNQASLIKEPEVEELPDEEEVDVSKKIPMCQEVSKKPEVTKTKLPVLEQQHHAMNLSVASKRTKSLPKPPNEMSVSVTSLNALSRMAANGPTSTAKATDVSACAWGRRSHKVKPSSMVTSIQSEALKQTPVNVSPKLVPKAVTASSSAVTKDNSPATSVSLNTLLSLQETVSSTMVSVTSSVLPGSVNSTIPVGIAVAQLRQDSSNITVKRSLPVTSSVDTGVHQCPPIITKNTEKPMDHRKTNQPESNILVSQNRLNTIHCSNNWESAEQVVRTTLPNSWIAPAPVVATTPVVTPTVWVGPAPFTTTSTPATSATISSIDTSQLPLPPVGYQLARDPLSGQIFLIPAPNIEIVDRSNIWSTYTSAPVQQIVTQPTTFHQQIIQQLAKKPFLHGNLIPTNRVETAQETKELKMIGAGGLNTTVQSTVAGITVQSTQPFTFPGFTSSPATASAPATLSYFYEPPTILHLTQTQSSTAAMQQPATLQTTELQQTVLQSSPVTAGTLQITSSSSSHSHTMQTETCKRSQGTSPLTHSPQHHQTNNQLSQLTEDEEDDEDSEDCLEAEVRKPASIGVTMAIQVDMDASTDNHDYEERTAVQCFDSANQTDGVFSDDGSQVCPAEESITVVEVAKIDPEILKPEVSKPEPEVFTEVAELKAKKQTDMSEDSSFDDLTPLHIVTDSVSDSQDVPQELKIEESPTEPIGKVEITVEEHEVATPLQIPVDSEEECPPVLPTQSHLVMDFIDHHGLDLLVDSIEEFACREPEPEKKIDDDEKWAKFVTDEEKDKAEPVQTVSGYDIDPNCTDGLGILCALAEQRFFEETKKTDKRPKSPVFLDDVKSPEMCYSDGGFQKVVSEDEMDPSEVEVRCKMAELQRKYRQKQKELAKLKPKKDKDDSDSCSRKSSSSKTKKRCRFSSFSSQNGPTLNFSNPTVHHSSCGNISDSKSGSELATLPCTNQINRETKTKEWASTQQQVPILNATNNSEHTFSKKSSSNSNKKSSSKKANNATLSNATISSSMQKSKSVASKSGKTESSSKSSKKDICKSGRSSNQQGKDEKISKKSKQNENQPAPKPQLILSPRTSSDSEGERLFVQFWRNQRAENNGNSSPETPEFDPSKVIKDYGRASKLQHVQTSSSKNSSENDSHLLSPASDSNDGVLDLLTAHEMKNNFGLAIAEDSSDSDDPISEPPPKKKLKSDEKLIEETSCSSEKSKKKSSSESRGRKKMAAKKAENSDNDTWNRRRSERIFLHDAGVTLPSTFTLVDEENGILNKDILIEPRSVSSQLSDNKFKRRFKKEVTVVKRSRSKEIRKDKTVPDELFAALRQCRLSENNPVGLSPVKSEDGGSSSEGDIPLSLLIEKNTPVPDLPSCLLDPEKLVDNLRVLAEDDGLYYAGYIKAIQAPDIYGIVLDGERGNRPHIFSREEILNTAIKEIKPTRVAQCPEGSRVCAYWSQQYRCLYPGTVAKSTSPNPLPEKNLVYVEFDDGDSGRIPIEDVRGLPQDSFPEPAEAAKPQAVPVPELPRMASPPPPLPLEQKVPENIPVTEKQSKKSKKLSKSVPKKFLKKVAAGNDCPSDSSNRSSKNLKKKSKKNKLIKSSDSGGSSKSSKCSCSRSEENSMTSSSPADESSSSASLLAKIKKRKKHKTDHKHRHHRHKHHHHYHHHKKRKHHVRSTAGAAISKVAEPDNVFMAPSSTNSNSSSMQSKPIARVIPSKKKSDLTVKIKAVPVEEIVAMEKIETVEEKMDSDAEGADKKKVSRKRKREKSGSESSKIAAFLPAQQLWSWFGKSFKRKTKGKGKKEYYKAIVRGSEMIRVGDCAVFLSTGRPHLPYVGRIDTMWESWGGNMVVKVVWFYHPEETKGKKLNLPKGALYRSYHNDENDVQTISHKCEVLSLIEYRKLKDNTNSGMVAASGTTSGTTTIATTLDNEDVYYLAGTYDPMAQIVTLVPGVL